MPVATPRRRTPLSREQKAFNRLAGKVRRLREALADWQEYTGRYDARVNGEMQPAEAALRDAQRRLARRLDELARATARGERLSRAQRRAVGQHIVLLAAEILQHGGPDPEVEALHDTYADMPHSELQRAELDEIEGMLGEILGDDALAGHRARSAEELFAHAREYMEAEARADAPHAGPGTSRARRAAARKATERDEALGTVRAIWRRLASAVHPDREPDPTERARKTVLMQRANEAYKRNDVLTLLSLQVELEQIDADHLASAPPQRLKHFLTVMKEQAAALEEELEECLVPFRVMLDRPSGMLRPEMVERALDEELAQMGSVTQGIEEDLARFDDPHQRRALLDALVAEEAGRLAYEDFDDLDGLPADDDAIAAIADILMAEYREQRVPGPRAKKKAKKKRSKSKSRAGGRKRR